MRLKWYYGRGGLSLEENSFSFKIRDYLCMSAYWMLNVEMQKMTSDSLTSTQSKYGD